jgi:hypothetical protein
MECLASSACHARLDPTLELTDQTPEWQPPSCLVREGDQVRCSLDPNSLEVDAAEGAPCCSGLTGSRTQKWQGQKGG